MSANMIQLDPDTIADLEAIEAEVIEVEDDSPLDDITQDQILAGHALVRGDSTSRTLIGSKAIHRHPEVMEAERAARERETEKRKKRRQRAAAKATRREQERDVKPIDPERLRIMLTLLGNLTHVVTSLTLARYNRFRRVLGDSTVDDVAQDAVLRIAEALARTNMEVLELAEATMWLRTAPQPYVSADGPDAARRLLGTMITVIRRVIVDTYRANTCTAYVETINEEGKTVYEARDVTLMSWELLETIAYDSRTDVDEFLSHSKGDRKPQRGPSVPGIREKRLFARAVVDEAINARGLSWLATMLLDPDHVRTDGAFMWTQHADRIWRGLGLPPIMTDNGRVHAEYAKRAVRVAFAFLPGVIAAAYEMVNDPVVMWHLDVTRPHQIVKAARKFRDLNYPQAQTYSKDAMDGGASLERTVELMDDPEAVRRALDIIYHQEA